MHTDMQRRGFDYGKTALTAQAGRSIILVICISISFFLAICSCSKKTDGQPSGKAGIAESDQGRTGLEYVTVEKNKLLSEGVKKRKIRA